MKQKKTDYLYIRIDPETRRQLQELTEVHERNQSDLVRVLIRQDYDARIGSTQTTVHQTISQQ